MYLDEEMQLQLKPQTAPQFHFGISPGKVFLLIESDTHEYCSVHKVVKGSVQKKTLPVFQETQRGTSRSWRFQIPSAGRWAVHIGSASEVFVEIAQQDANIYDVTFDAKGAPFEFGETCKGVSTVFGVKLSSLTEKVVVRTSRTVWERLGD